MPRYLLHPNVLLACIFILCFAGALISGQLLKLHDNVWAAATKTNTGFFARMCGSANAEDSNCISAVKGAWSEIKVPVLRPHRDFTFSLRRVTVPIAFIGLAYFTTLGIWFMFIGPARPIGGGWHRIIFAMAVAGCAVSVFYLSIMAIGRTPGSTPWCFGCLAIHAINFVMLPIVWAAVRGNTWEGRFPAHIDWHTSNRRDTHHTRSRIHVYLCRFNDHRLVRLSPRSPHHA